MPADCSAALQSSRVRAPRSLGIISQSDLLKKESVEKGVAQNGNFERTYMITYATTFSGIGGWEIGLNACGWKLQWQCEINPFCREILKARFGVPIYDDITTIVQRNPKRVDALIGSPPCQPFSIAGLRRGVGDARDLYPAFIDLVGYLRPQWVLMEQVAAILSLDGGRAFGGYVGGLAALGYHLIWHCIPAAAVGAPHRRDRLWIVAYSDGLWGSQPGGSIGQQWEWPVDSCKIAPLGHTNSAGLERLRESGKCPGKWTAWEDGEISLGRDGKRRIINPAVPLLAHGIPRRMERLSSTGNAVVPQIPYLIGRAINLLYGM